MTEPFALRETKRKIAAFEKEHGHPPRIMLLSETEGTFGHARITSILAQRLKEAGAEVVVVSGDIDEQIFSFGDSLKKIPELIYTLKDGEAHVTTPEGTLYKEDEEYKERRTTAIRAIAQEFQPDLIAVEFHPLSYRDFRVPDVQALLDYKEKTRSPAPLVTIARDNTIYKINGVRLEALKDFDHVLLRGWKEIPWDDAHEIPQEIEEKIEPLGHILDISHSPTSSDNAPVMVFASGGYKEHNNHFFETAIKASKEGEFSHHPWNIIVSQDYPPEAFKKLQELAENEGNGKVTVTHTYLNERFSQDLAQCAAAVVRGSYNITLELIALKKPFVLIPRTSKGFEIEDNGRAQFFAQHNIAAILEEKDLPENGGQKLAAALHKATQLTPKEFQIENGSQFASRLCELAMRAKERNKSHETTWQKQQGATAGAQTKGR